MALSTTEAEYIALSTATQEAVWIRSLLREWGFKMLMPTTIWSDNNGAIQLTYNPVHHKRTKHIEIKFHFIRDKVKSGDVVIDKVHTTEMLADVLTKNTSAQTQLHLHPRLMGVGEPIKPSPKRIRVYKRIINPDCKEEKEE